MHLADLSAGVFVDAARACLAIRGRDARAWLGGMITCDVASLEKEASAVYGCALDVKGKIAADLVAVRREGVIDVFVPASVAAALAESWDRYVVMEDVEIAREDRVLVEVHGARASEVVANAGLAGRAASLDLLGVGGVVVDASAGESIAERLEKSGVHAIDAETMGRLRVEAARATWGRDVDAHHYVQEAGLQDRAVSFQKGCYVGQEVVCMLQMRGKVHRKLVQLRVERAPAIGAKVAADGADVGAVTSVAPAENGGALALAMIKTASAEIGKQVEIDGVRAVVTAEAH